MSNPVKSLLLVSVLFCSFLSSLFAASSIKSDSGEISAPPIKEVVLYKHGMGYIEREGTVDNNVVFSMFFSEDQMNDLLTSFYAVDLNGGRISSVLYETEKPISQKKQGIKIDIPEHAALSELLVQLKGAEISAKTADETVNGRILGIEPVIEVIDGKKINNGNILVMMTDSGSIKSLNLSGLLEYKIENEMLKRDLNKLLNISLDSKYTNRKRLTLTADGDGKRILKIGYLVNMPVWKCSYRIIFDSKDTDKAFIQGWAQAENNTEDDWNDIRISFVAGNPLSYIMNMYSPLYVNRPHIPVPGLQNLQVDWNVKSSAENIDKIKKSAGIAAQKHYAKRMRSAANKELMMADSVISEAEEAFAPAPAMSMQEALGQSAGTSVSGTEVGELFSYNLSDTISIPRGEAAMVPIVTRQIDGKRILYYKEAFSSKVMNAFVLENNTGLTLDAGAVTFYEGNTSLGEGILGHTLTSGSQEVIPYAVSSSVDITPGVNHERSNYFKGKIVDGILTLTCTETITNLWKLNNRGDDAAVLWLNQPVSYGYALSEPEKPLKEIDNNYRFEIELAANEEKTFKVIEKRDVNNTISLINCNQKTIAFYASMKYLDKDTRTFLAELGNMMNRKVDYQRQIDEWQRQVKQLSDKQQRLRDNIRMLNNRTSAKEKNLRATWVDALADAEKEINELTIKINETSKKVLILEQDISAKIKNFKI